MPPLPRPIFASEVPKFVPRSRPGRRARHHKRAPVVLSINAVRGPARGTFTSTLAFLFWGGFIFFFWFFLYIDTYFYTQLEVLRLAGAALAAGTFLFCSLRLSRRRAEGGWFWGVVRGGSALRRLRMLRVSETPVVGRAFVPRSVPARPPLVSSASSPNPALSLRCGIPGIPAGQLC